MIVVIFIGLSQEKLIKSKQNCLEGKKIFFNKREFGMVGLDWKRIVAIGLGAALVGSALAPVVNGLIF